MFIQKVKPKIENIYFGQDRNLNCQPLLVKPKIDNKYIYKIKKMDGSQLNHFA